MWEPVFPIADTSAKCHAYYVSLGESQLSFSTSAALLILIQKIWFLQFFSKATRLSEFRNSSVGHKILINFLCIIFLMKGFLVAV
jgi:hypothetical protein